MGSEARRGNEARIGWRPRALLLPITLAAVSLACEGPSDPEGECDEGTAFSVSIGGSSNVPAVDSGSYCAGATNGVLQVRINEGVLATLTIGLRTLDSNVFEPRTYSCADDELDVTMSINSRLEQDADSYISPEWQARLDVEDSSCELTIESGENTGRVRGSFSGTLMRHKLSGEGDPLEISFDFSSVTDAE